MPNKPVTLYLDHSAPPPVVPVSLGDTDWSFHFTVMYNGAVYAPNVSYVILTGNKPDGNVFAFTGSKSNNLFVVTPANVQLTAVAGAVPCELRLIASNGRSVGTGNFVLLVEPGPEGIVNVASSSALTAYVTILNQLQRIMEQAATIPGDVSGYISDWLEAHISGSQAVAVDNTLSVEGAAADAKATGDRLTALEDATIETDDTLTIEGAAADAKAVGMKLVPFNAAKAGFVPAPGAKANKKYYLAGNGKFEPVPFDSTACAALIGILRAGIYEQDVAAAISALADALHVNESSEDEETFQFGQAIEKGTTARTLTGLESFNLTEIRLVVAIHSDFQAGAFCLVSAPVGGSPYLGINASAGFNYSNSGSYPGNFTATPADLSSFVGDEPKEVRIKWNNQSGWESRKYISSLKLLFNGYNPSCGFTLFRLSGYDGSTKLFNLVSSGINGELFDTMGGRTYNFDTTNGLSIVEVEEE